MDVNRHKLEDSLGDPRFTFVEAIRLTLDYHPAHLDYRLE